MMQPATGPQPAQKGSDPSLPKLTEADREVQRVKAAGERVAEAERGTGKDPRLAMLKELHSDASYVIKFHKAGASDKMDLLHQRIQDKQLEVTDPRFRAEMVRGQSMMQNPLGEKEIEAREQLLTRSQNDLKAALKLFGEAHALRKEGKTDDATVKMAAAEKQLETAVRSLYPAPKPEK